MTATTIRQKLYDYIRVAEDKKIKAIYTMLESEIEEVQDYWNDKDFVSEIDKRSSEYKKNNAIGKRWSEVKEKILSPVKPKK